MLAAHKDAALNAELGMPRAPLPPSISVDRTGRTEQNTSHVPGALVRPVKYDLPGIRERMKKKLGEMKEVGRRHEQDADRACDDMVESQGEIDRAEEEVGRPLLLLLLQLQPNFPTSTPAPSLRYLS